MTQQQMYNSYTITKFSQLTDFCDHRRDSRQFIFSGLSISINAMLCISRCSFCLCTKLIFRNCHIFTNSLSLLSKIFPNVIALHIAGSKSICGPTISYSNDEVFDSEFECLHTYIKILFFNMIVNFRLFFRLYVNELGIYSIYTLHQSNRNVYDYAVSHNTIVCSNDNNISDEEITDDEQTSDQPTSC
jgi:hypothetical protein